MHAWAADGLIGNGGMAEWPPGGVQEAELQRLEALTYSFADALPIKAVQFVTDHPADFPTSPAS